MADLLERSQEDAGTDAETTEPSGSSRLMYPEQADLNALGYTRPLSPDRLYRHADILKMSFATTAELQPIDGLIGQKRALDAINFGTRINKSGYNLFVIGPHGARMQEAVKAVLSEEARARSSPSDWVYVINFADVERPIAIELPAGRARRFAAAMHDLIDDLKSALPAVFQSEDYQTRRSAIDDSFQKKQGEAFSALRDKAGEKNVVIVRTPFGFALAPAEKGEVVPPDQFHGWPEEKRTAIQEVIETLEKELEHIVHQIPQWERERRDEIRKLNRETAKFAVDQQIEETKSEFLDLPRIIEHIERVRSDLIENVAPFVIKSEEEPTEPVDATAGNAFDRYEINVLVARDRDDSGAPVIEELHPTLGNLIGRIDYVSSHGVLITNFRLIKAGAMHRANGGYLLLDVRSLLTEPFSWTALKRTIRQGEIKIEDVTRFLGFTSTVSLEPDPIPLNVKVVLFGDRLLYFLLMAFDPEVSQHFKVLADFENNLERTPQNEELLARFIAGIAQRDALRPFEREAVGLILEHAARLAEHADKLSLLVEQLRDILNEADFWAEDAKRSVVSRADVDRALRERIQRAARIRDRIQESILQQVALIDTSGQSVGQINGLRARPKILSHKSKSYESCSTAIFAKRCIFSLHPQFLPRQLFDKTHLVSNRTLSVSEFGGFSFGRPTRITCQVRPGAGKLVDIEREVELGGPIHSKGVLILSGFLAGRYALDVPMSLYASLVFEQSYSGVEGDSASSAELYALMSALANLPLRQDLAVTGSVNQHGAVQAIGGVNEKIEGFFDICRARGLAGAQGVLIPEANVQHLMLRHDVVEACAAGKFAIYPISTIDQGIALLTGLAAGERGTDGRYPADSVNRLIEERLRSFASIRQRFGREPEAALPAD